MIYHWAEQKHHVHNYLGEQSDATLSVIITGHWIHMPYVWIFSNFQEAITAGVGNEDGLMLYSHARVMKTKHMNKRLS